MTFSQLHSLTVTTRASTLWEIKMLRLLSLSLVGCLLAACGVSHRDDDPAFTATQQIGPAGGTVELTDGATVVIPAGALSQATRISITVLGLDSVADLPSNLEAAGAAYAFEPHGTRFARAITIEVPFDGSATNLRALRLDDEQDTTWQTVTGSRRVNATLSMQSTTFSVIVAARPINVGGVSGEGGVGGTGGVGGVSGVGGFGGVGGLGGVGGTGGQAPTFAECTLAANQHAPGGSVQANECAGCLCNAPADRANVIACDANCWGLVQCVELFGCGGDIACVADNCTAYLSAVSTATAFAPAFQACTACRAGDTTLEQRFPDVTNWSAFELVYPTSHSGYDGVHNFQLPMRARCVTGLPLSAWHSDPVNAVVFDVDPNIANGVLITVVEPVANITIAAVSGTLGGTAPLHITIGTPQQWELGNQRFNNGADWSLNILMPTPPPPDTKCTNCHGANTSTGFDILITPTQVARVSDNALSQIMTTGTKPADVAFRVLPETMMFGAMTYTNAELYAQFHLWNASADELTGMNLYLRSLTPAGEGCVINQQTGLCENVPVSTDCQ